MPATAFINGAYVLKLPSVMTAALALLVSSCCHSFVDRHSAPAASRGGGAEHYPQRADGLLLHHLWLVEQIRSEQALLARLRAERKALQAGVPPQSKDKSALRGGVQCARAPDAIRCLSVQLRPAPVAGPHRFYAGVFCRVGVNWRPMSC